MGTKLHMKTLEQMEKTYKNLHNYKVIHEDFGTDNVKGFVTRIKPDQYLIGINTRLSEAEQEQTLRHELYHIEHDHFDGTMSVDQIEIETHKAIE